MKYIVDRIEGQNAVLEDEKGRHTVVPLSILPAEIRESCCLTETDGIFTADPALERRRRRSAAKRLRALLLRRGPGSS